MNRARGFLMNFIHDLFRSGCFSFIINISIESGRPFLTIHIFIFPEFFFLHSLHAMRWWKKSIMMLLLLLLFTSLPLSHFYFIFYFHARKSFFLSLVHSIFNPTRNTVMDCTNCFYCWCCFCHLYIYCTITCQKRCFLV